MTAVRYTHAVFIGVSSMHLRMDSRALSSSSACRAASSPWVCTPGLRVQHKLIVFKGYTVMSVVKNGICLNIIMAA